MMFIDWMSESGRFGVVDLLLEFEFVFESECKIGNLLVDDEIEKCLVSFE